MSYSSLYVFTRTFSIKLALHSDWLEYIKHTLLVQCVPVTMNNSLWLYKTHSTQCIIFILCKVKFCKSGQVWGQSTVVLSLVLSCLDLTVTWLYAHTTLPFTTWLYLDFELSLRIVSRLPKLPTYLMLRTLGVTPQVHGIGMIFSRPFEKLAVL